MTLHVTLLLLIDSKTSGTNFIRGLYELKLDLTDHQIYHKAVYLVPNTFKSNIFIGIIFIISIKKYPGRNCRKRKKQNEESEKGFHHLNILQNL